MPDGELSVFDLSISKLLVLAVIALVVFGPKELPRVAAQAGRALRDLRKIAENAKNDLREGLGPEFADFDIEDLNPKRFVQKHLFDDLNADVAAKATMAAQSPRPAAARTAVLAPGERAPYDPDAT
ncbi:MAG TPA: sec-independent translocase [Streptosporangiaceae bacterium]|nr:sec-independent translocase [Streptosporangiaceae bacterium]